MVVGEAESVFDGATGEVRSEFVAESARNLAEVFACEPTITHKTTSYGRGADTAALLLYVAGAAVTALLAGKKIEENLDAWRRLGVRDEPPDGRAWCPRAVAGARWRVGPGFPLNTRQAMFHRSRRSFSVSPGSNPSADLNNTGGSNNGLPGDHSSRLSACSSKYSRIRGHPQALGHAGS